MRRLPWLALLFALCGWSCSARAQAVHLKSDRDFLRRIDGVSVIVAPPPPCLSDSGLSAEAIRIAIEIHLRTAGIRVLADDGIRRDPSTVGILIFIASAVDLKDDGRCAIASRLFVQRPVTLYGDGNVIFVSGWDVSDQWVIGRHIINSTTRQIIQGLVETFSNELLEASPGAARAPMEPPQRPRPHSSGGRASPPTPSAGVKL